MSSTAQIRSNPSQPLLFVFPSSSTLNIDSRIKKKGFKIGILYIAALCDDPCSFHTARRSWGTSGPKSRLVDHSQGVPLWGHQPLPSMDLKLQNGKTGINAAQRRWKRGIRKAGKGRKGVPSMGKVPGRAEDATPVTFWGRATSASHKLPNPALLFGWVSRDVNDKAMVPSPWVFLRGLSAGSSKGGQGWGKPTDPGLPYLPQLLFQPFTPSDIYSCLKRS